MAQAEQTTGLRLIVNGEERQFAGPLTIQGLLEQLQAPARYVAVAVNGEVVRRADHAGYALKNGDRIEIVHMVGGGST